MTPALAASSMLSRKGKKASDASTAPRDALAGLAHGQVDRIDPAHLPGADADHHAALGQHDGVALDVLAHQPGEAQVGQLRSGRAPASSPLCIWCEVVGPAQVARLHQQAAVHVAENRAFGRGRSASSGPVRSRRTFFFQVGRVVSTAKAARLKPGAMMHSMKRFGSVICMAVASSTSRLKARTPP